MSDDLGKLRDELDEAVGQAVADVLWREFGDRARSVLGRAGELCLSARDVSNAPADEVSVVYELAPMIVRWRDE